MAGIPQKTGKKELLAILLAEFPQIDYSHAVLNNKGWDHVTVILDDHYVFRFPRKGYHQRKIVVEIRLLDKLRPTLPLDVPHYTFVAKKSVFGGYELIKGKELTKTLFRRLTDSQKKRCAADLGAFLTALHDFPVKSAKKIGLREEWSLAEEKQEYETRKQVVFSVLSDGQKAFVKAFACNYFSMQVPLKLSVIHHDLSDAHILINEGRISGIIDFGDASLGDPAKDFSWLWELGDRFTLDVLRNYDRPVDPGFLVRSQFYHFAGTLSEIYHGVADKKPVLLRKSLQHLGRQMRMNRFLGE